MVPRKGRLGFKRRHRGESVTWWRTRLYESVVHRLPPANTPSKTAFVRFLAERKYDAGELGAAVARANSKWHYIFADWNASHTDAKIRWVENRWQGVLAIL